MNLQLSQRNLLYINLALGLFAGFSNGAALILVWSGQAEKLGDKAGEIAAWSFVGFLLALSSCFAFIRNEKTASVLRFQTYVVIGLVLALAAWAATIVTGKTATSARVVWDVGYLSLLALYCWLLGSHTYSEPRYAVYRQLLVWVFVPVCVAIDIFTYIKVT